MATPNKALNPAKPKHKQAGAASPQSKLNELVARITQSQGSMLTAQANTLESKQAYARDVLGGTVVEQTKLRDQQLNGLEQGVSQLIRSAQTTERKIEDAEDDMFYGLKSFFNDDIPSVDELEDKQTGELNAMRNSLRARDLVLSRYDRQLNRAKLGRDELDYKGNAEAEAQTGLVQAAGVVGGLQRQVDSADVKEKEALVAAEAERKQAEQDYIQEQVSSMSKEGIEASLKDPANTELPPTVLREELKRRYALDAAELGMEKLEIEVKNLREEGSVDAGVKSKPMTVAAMIQLRDYTLTTFTEGMSLPELEAKYKEAKGSSTQMASLQLPGTRAYTYKASELLQALESKREERAKEVAQTFEATATVSEFQPNVDTLGQLAMNLPDDPSVSGLLSQGEQLMFELRRVEEAGGRPSVPFVNAIASLNEKATNVINETIEREVANAPKVEKPMQSSFLRTGVVPRREAVKNPQQLPAASSDPAIIAVRPAYAKAANVLQSNLEILLKQQGLGADGGLDIKALLAGGLVDVSAEVYRKYNESLMQAVTAKPSVSQGFENNSPLDYVQEDLLSRFVDWSADKTKIKERYPEMWAPNGEGKFNTGADLLRGMFVSDVKNSRESAFPTLLDALFNNEMQAEFMAANQAQTQGMFSARFIESVIADNKLDVLLGGAVREQFNVRDVVTRVMDEFSDAELVPGRERTGRNWAYAKDYDRLDGLPAEDYQNAMRTTAEQLERLFGITTQERAGEQ